MIEIKSKKKKVEREPLVSIDGVEYTVPKGNFPTEFALRFLDYVDTFGADAGHIFLIKNGLEPSGAWEALQNVEGLDPAAFADIVSAVRTKAVGALEAPKGKLKAV